MFVITVGCIDDCLEGTEILNEKGIDYRCILWGITKNEAATRSNKSVLEDKGVYKWILA